MKFIYLIFPLCFLGNIVGAQDISRQVIALNGGNQTVNDINISYTIGQPIIETQTVGDFILTQGFQQPDESVITSAPFLEFDQTSFEIFPQPASNHLIINLSDQLSDVLHIDLFSLTGVRLKSIISNPKVFNTIRLNLEDLLSGFYMLSITDFKNNQKFTEPLIIVKK